jgi:transcriptional regulator with XRE-family HTH domain
LDPLITATTWGEVVGRVLSHARKAASMPQIEMARIVGLSKGAWSRIEHGARAFRIDQLEIAAQALGTTSEAILSDARMLAEQLKAQGIRVETARDLAIGRRTGRAVEQLNS